MSLPPPVFVLASASPARRKLLLSAGIEPIVCPSQFDESQIQLSDPAELVQELALGKANAVARQIALDAAGVVGQSVDPARGVLVLGCDSVLALNGDIHGKPADAAEAIARWKSMRSNVGYLYTGHALIDVLRQKTLVRCQMTQVQFADVSDRQISAYVATGEPLNCAGCFTLEGRGGLFVEKLVGCHTNVIGLSLPLLRTMLHELGYDAVDYWA